MKRSWLLPGLLVLLAACSDAPTTVGIGDSREVGRWQTWVIGDVASIDVPPPPAATAEEIAQIAQLQQSLTAADEALIRTWDVPVTTPWTESMLELLERYWVLLPDVRQATPAMSARALALLHVAIYDAVVAAWHAKYLYNRAAPYEAAPQIRRRVHQTSAPSYPSEHAAAAAAAAALIHYLFPLEDSATWNARARAAARSRVLGGAAYPSDIDAGMALGRAVAERVIVYAKDDHSADEWTGSIPPGAEVWRPTPPRLIDVPFDPMAGRWRTWVLARGDVLRSAPPPSMGSAHFMRDVAELRNVPSTRTAEQAEAARFWGTGPPPLRWTLFLEDEIAGRGLSTPDAARAHALASIAMYDALVACWDGKYHYWLLRPITYDESIATLFATPPFPGYPSGHSTMSAAAAEVFAHLFKDRARYYRDRALEASNSRVWAGVHFRFDIEAGEALGRAVGEAVVATVQQD